MVEGLAINGKFLGAPLNGVHRTAAQFSEHLMRRAVGRVPARLVAPRPAEPSAEFPHLRAVVARGALGRGQGWEMVTLPLATRGELLVNLCNLAPLAHGNSLVMIHDAQTFLYPQDYTGRQARAYRRLLPLIAWRARRVLTVSQFARASLLAHGVGREDKIEVVHNGTDHLMAVPPDPDVLARHGLTPGGYVLTLGSAKGYKNLRTPFAAMREPLPGGQPLVIAGGPGPEPYRVRGWEPPASAVFTGFVSDAELRALYAGAAAFVFPSLTEGFGLPPIEAMHCRTPVIAAKAGAVPEICADAAVLVEAEDPAAYRAAIRAVLGDGDLARDLRRRGALRANTLSWEAAGENLWRKVEALLDRGI